MVISIRYRDSFDFGSTSQSTGTNYDIKINYHSCLKRKTKRKLKLSFLVLRRLVSIGLQNLICGSLAKKSWLELVESLQR